MDANETSISAGLIIGDLLAQDPDIAETVTDIFPVIADEDVRMPYISYRAAKTGVKDVKNEPGSETLSVVVSCFAPSYAGSVYLAEMARKALDGKAAKRGSLTMRGCRFADREEDRLDVNTFVQHLEFRLRI